MVESLGSAQDNVTELWAMLSITGRAGVAGTLPLWAATGHGANASTEASKASAKPERLLGSHTVTQT